MPSTPKEYGLTVLQHWDPVRALVRWEPRLAAVSADFKVYLVF
jgi:hypothetical protein